MNTIFNKTQKLSDNAVLKIKKTEIMRQFTEDDIIDAFQDGFDKGFDKKEKEILTKLQQNKIKKISNNILSLLKTINLIYKVIEDNGAKADSTNFSFVRVDTRDWEVETIIPIRENIYYDISKYSKIYSESAPLLYKLNFIRGFSFMPYNEDDIDLDSLACDNFIKI